MENKKFLRNIKNWLNKSGYALEMRVANKFSGSGIEIRQPYFYEDFKTNKVREIDIWAHKSKRENDINVRFNYVIECKNAQKKPWIVFKSDQSSFYFQEQGTDIPYYIRPSNIAGNFFLLTFQQLIRKKLPTFEVPNYLGYGISETFKDSETDRTYDAIKQVLNATYYLKDKSFKSYESAEIYYPIIVIDGVLLEAKMNRNDEIELAEVESSTILYENNIFDYGFPFIKIIPFTHLDKFLSKLDLLFEELFEENLDEFKFVTNKIKENKIEREG